MSDESLRGDELVSAYLDGEASPAEVAEIERDDALMARVEELRSIRDAMSRPVVPVSAERRDQMISAALALAGTEADQRREAEIVPIRRRHQTRLAVAAAVMLLAAVVSAGLVVGRGGDQSPDVAAEATTATESAPDGMAAEAAAAPESAPAETAAPTEADMAMADASAGYGTAEEPVAEEALAAAMAEVAEAADPEVVAQPEAQSEAGAAEAAAADAGAELAMEEPAEDAAEASTANIEEGDPEHEEELRRAAEAAVPVVDLGTFENLESLFDNIAARWSLSLEDGTTADSGSCYAAVDERALGLDVETAQPFTATVGAEDRMRFDGRFARRADGSAVIIYAAPPSCETGSYDLPS